MKNKKFFLFQNETLLLEKNEGEYTLPHFKCLPENVAIKNDFFIGNFNDHDCFISDCVASKIDPSFEWTPLKQAMEKCGKTWFSVIARAQQILQWDRNHQYCAKCGKSLIRITTQFEKKCTDCNMSYFARISPAVIILIEKENKLLMARKKEFPSGVYGLIAGFAEPGETLEETAHREAYEEVGITIKNLRYAGSQSWPFPDSLMIGFRAEYVSGDITYHDGEIEHANWYGIKDIPGYPSSSISIARKMIEDFVKEKN